MKAIAVNSFVMNYSSLTPSDIPPPTPTSSQTLVRITHAALNYVDLLYARGKHQNNRTLVRPPFILGLEFAGTVLHSPSASHFQPGDHVIGSDLGAFAEQISVDTDKLMRVPEGWTSREAAGLSATAPVSYDALVRVAKVQPGETVLVHAAAGGLGVMAVQIAKALGARVIATVGSEEKANVVRSLGVDLVVCYTQEGWEKRILEATEGARGVDVTFDSVGLVERSIRCSRYNARIVVVGFAGREGNLEKVPTNKILLKSITVLGYRFGEYGRQVPDGNTIIWEGLNALVNKELIKPVIYDRRFKGLEAVPEAMESMARREVWGKAVVEIVEKEEKAKF